MADELKDVAEHIAKTAVNFWDANYPDTNKFIVVFKGFLDRNFRFTVGAEEKIIAHKVEPQKQKMTIPTDNSLSATPQINMSKFVTDVINQLNKHTDEIEALKKKVGQ